MLRQFVGRLLGRNQEPIAPLPAGIYHFQTPAEDPNNYRFHLRIQPDGSGYLVLNAATILHLNQTATEYAYLFISEASPESAASHMTTRYAGIRKSVASNEFEEFKAQVYALLESQDQDPVALLGIEREALYSGEISAPYRLDCALTYRLPPMAPPEAAPHKNVDRELSTPEWREILDKAWQAGIPHILFTGGEPTLRTDLPELITHAEQNGQVTGLLTDGHQLKDSTYLKELLSAGLDHTLITLNPDLETSWEAIASFQYWQNILAEDIFVALHITITEENKRAARSILGRVLEAGISAVSLTAASKDLAAPLQEYHDIAGSLGLDLIWDLPVPYSALNPVNLDLDLAQHEEGSEPQSIGKGSLYVEPDGDVLLSRERPTPLGNLLREPWESIWAKVTHD